MFFQGARMLRSARLAVAGAPPPGNREAYLICVHCCSLADEAWQLYLESEMLQVLRLMRLAPAEEADRQAKAALYTKYAELLPAALMAGAPDSLQLVTDLLNGIKIVIAANIVPHQNLFR